ncbi:MAG: hypothetical protein HeimC2_34500 [Candidatus Heimdallarchaeota archaeon LC_2]|nr:MAG: hypothetical protein HeimC2_34470 [Candidatus Heimdallarchaeota archaeon LC_2]OLS21230.1 MAG: hypothetical protein HeimC2_34480 [Candidatus Heimdallarchaeota archaeon LC_2]OLS21231.1 MAG: hypothetical protein HeimC2_34490 [Candidatus Heimdallarchaeota archaeon LC_2]OLS21232.1 MAG: hypothetical protein HeimC2_34500 [Candidatus Heimdallarchaeota archaeon LC_2]
MDYKRQRRKLRLLKQKLLLIYGEVMRLILNHHLGLYDGPVHNTEMISIQNTKGKWIIKDNEEN